jgi:glycosyltransferase involved in cell wall biosynthesis
MKIAQIAPLAESVPPKLYGGTERVVSYLTEALVERGHKVTLFASGDSVTSASLVACTPQALRLDSAIGDPLPFTVLQLEAVRRRADEFDILHFHTDFLHFPIFRQMAGRTLTTLHGRLDVPGLGSLYREFCDMPVVSVSNAQRRPLPHARWAGTVLHGIPQSLTRFCERPKADYLAFLGRISPEKRPDRAITVARRVGIKLKIAAKVDRADQAYFERQIRPLLDHPLIEWIGEIGDNDKAEFLGNALALIFPIDWPEPFGLVMIEAMACGTPTIAYRCGSVPEIIDEGVSGWMVNDEDQAAAAVARTGKIDRMGVRKCFERRFTAERMADDYIRLYQASIRRLQADSGQIERVTN